MVYLSIRRQIAGLQALYFGYNREAAKYRDINRYEKGVNVLIIKCLFVWFSYWNTVLSYNKHDMKIKYVFTPSRYLSAGTIVLGIHRFANAVMKIIYTYYL